MPFIWEGKKEKEKHDNDKMQDQPYFIKHVKMMQTQQTHSKVNAHYTLHKHNLQINAKIDDLSFSFFFF